MTIAAPSKKELSIANILGEAWQLTSGLKWPVFWLLIILIIVSFLNFSILFPVTLITAHLPPNLAALPKPSTSTVVTLIIIGFFLYFLTWFIVSILVMLAVRKSIGLQAKVSLAYSDCKNAFRNLYGIYLIGAGISLFLFLLGIFLGGSFFFNLFKIVLYLLTYYMIFSITTFAIPLGVTKRCSSLTAFQVGIQAMNKNWWQIVLLYFIMFVLIFISIIPVGIGIIWTFPMNLLIGGILFREVFGLQKKAPVPAEETT